MTCGDRPVITVLLADDQAMNRGAFAALIGLESDMRVVAQVGSGDEVVSAALRSTPDVALLDVQMPGLDGLSAAASLAEQLPGCRVIILTTFGRPAICAGQWRQGPPDSWSRTPRPSS